LATEDILVVIAKIRRQK